ncbi:MAG: hypothetical protein ACRYFL_01460 [Janthinobacterium lividum]
MMKDELIDTINAKIMQNRRLMTVSAFSLVGINVLVTLLITHFKHPELVNMTDATLVKSFFWNFG